MMAVKGGTQTWSKAQQVSGLKSDQTQNLSAGDREKALGEENVGEVLNKIADPNWVDPEKTRRVGNSEMDKDAFLKLFLAQLKNQDPTNPMQNHELAAQLAQFTSLEKLSNIDTGITSLAQAQQPKSNFDALQMIGKNVTGDSSKIIRFDEKEVHDVRYELAADAQEVNATIFDGAGNVAHKMTFHNLKKGKNEFVWKGMKGDGQIATPGEYMVVIDAKGSNGNKVFAETKFEGIVSGVSFTAQGPQLSIGNQTIRMTDIKKIVDPSMMPKEVPVAVPAQPPTKGVAPKAENKAPQLTQERKAPSMNTVQNAPGLDSVAMSRGLMSQLNKQVASR